MKQKPIFLIAVLCILSFSSILFSATIKGHIFYEGKYNGIVYVNLYKLKVLSNQKVIALQKRDIYGAIPPFKKLILKDRTDFSFEAIPSGYYSVIAFIDLNGNSALDFYPPEPFGWFSKERGGRWSIVDLKKKHSAKANCYLWKPTPITKKDMTISHGQLKWIDGVPVIRLFGTASQRGYAHGFLLAQQILDFFRSYILEDSWKLPSKYKEIFVPFLLKNFNFPSPLMVQCKAIIKGMKDSGVPMYVPGLGREFKLVDLLAINCYIEKRAAFPVKLPKDECTQFVFWGSMTKKGSAGGSLIAARNMDGECDVRKVTVSDFVIFAITPFEKGRKRWISFMWPGFVGTLSGINMDGLYCMENAGGSMPGPVVGGIVPCTWIQASLFETTSQDVNPWIVLKRLKKFACSGGGVTTPGSIMVFAMPYKGQKWPAFIYEGDRFGGKIRLPANVRPNNPFVIMASNYFLSYGFNESHPLLNFGRHVSLSSLWRYEAGKNAIEAWIRLKHPISIDDAKRLLQMVSHGSTEHSVIFDANRMQVYVAVDDLMADMWDAPYLKWHKFKIKELF